MSPNAGNSRHGNEEGHEMQHLQPNCSQSSPTLATPAAEHVEVTSDNVVQAQGTDHDGYPVRRRLFQPDQREGDDGDHSRFDNPFGRWLDDQVDQVARRIALEYGLKEMEDLFIKAGRILRSSEPKEWTGISLTEEERACLEHESSARFFDQPWPLQATFLMLFIAATVQGWSQIGINGANLSWWKDIGTGSNVDVTVNCSPASGHSWLYGAVNAAPYLAAGLFGAQLSDPLINELLFGRRGAILLSAVLVMGSSIGGAFSQRWWHLLISRIVLGIGMGCKAAVVPVFAAEIAPAHLRGTLVMNWQVFDALGICLGYSANLVASTAGHSAWRWQIFSAAIPAFALLCGASHMCWDSPRFLMKHEQRLREKYEKRRRAWMERRRRRVPALSDFRQHQNEDASPEDRNEREALKHSSWARLWTAIDFESSPALPYTSEAFKTLVILRGHPLLAAKELMFAHCQLLVETMPSQSSADEYMNFSLESRSSWLSRLADMANREKPYLRRELYAAAVVMIGQQLCGVNILIFYSSNLFCNTESTTGTSQDWHPLLLSWGIGLANVIFAIPAYWWIESLGRRWLVLTTLPALAITMAAIAGGFTIVNLAHRQAVVTVFVYVYMAIYSWGMGPVPFTLSAEIFPLEHRMVGMSLVVSLNMLGAGLETLLAPLVVRPEVLTGAFAVLNMVAFVAAWVFVREVASARHFSEERKMTSLSLEELFNIFKWPTLLHFQYQWAVQLPYYWMRLKYIVRFCFGVEHDLPEPPALFHDWAIKPKKQRRNPEPSATR